MRDYVLIKDPVHGYIKVYEHEKCIVDTPAFQRLRRIKQLPAAHYVYPGAVHSRFSHSLGVMYVAGVFAEHIYSKLDIERSEKERLYLIARLLGLLHDIGHGPFSHTFEDHVLTKYGVNHEIMGGRIVRESPELSKCFDECIEEELGVSADVMGKLVEAPTPEAWPLTSAVGAGVTEKSLYYVIRGPFSADIVDYLLRDSLFTGANYGIGLDWERLAYHSVILDDKLVLEHKAKDVLDHLLIARLLMFKTVYFHKTVRAFDKVAGTLMIKAEENLNVREAVDDVSRYILLDDEYVMSHPKVRELEEVRYLLNRVVPYKVVYELLQPLEGHISAFVKFSKSVIELMFKEKLTELAGEDVSGEAVFVDTPKLPTNPMFEEAELRILKLDGSVETHPIRDTAAGLMPKELAFFRIYVHERYGGFVNALRSAAMTMFEGGGLRVHY